MGTTSARPSTPGVMSFKLLLNTFYIIDSAIQAHYIPCAFFARMESCVANEEALRLQALLGIG